MSFLNKQTLPCNGYTISGPDRHRQSNDMSVLIIRADLYADYITYDVIPLKVETMIHTYS